MNLLNELLNISEAKQGTTLVGIILASGTVTNKTKNEVWDDDFICNHNPDIISLEGAPKEVTGDFMCNNNPKLKSLEGAPVKVGGDFNYFDCSDKLKSLEGAPREIGGDFVCCDTKLTSLKGIHKQITNLGGKFISNNSPIRSHVLGLLLIKGCTGVELDNEDVQDILNKYLPNTIGNKAVIECQSELLDADLDDYAEL